MTGRDEIALERKLLPGGLCSYQNIEMRSRRQGVGRKNFKGTIMWLKTLLHLL